MAAEFNIHVSLWHVDENASLLTKATQNRWWFTDSGESLVTRSPQYFWGPNFLKYILISLFEFDFTEQTIFHTV